MPGTITTSTSCSATIVRLLCSATGLNLTGSWRAWRRQTSGSVEANYGLQVGGRQAKPSTMRALPIGACRRPIIRRWPSCISAPVIHLHSMLSMPAWQSCPSCSDSGQAQVPRRGHGSFTGRLEDAVAADRVPRWPTTLLGPATGLIARSACSECDSDGQRPVVSQAERKVVRDGAGVSARRPGPGMAQVSLCAKDPPAGARKLSPGRALLDAPPANPLAGYEIRKRPVSRRELVARPRACAGLVTWSLLVSSVGRG